jgi:hypothetical protein
MPRTARLIVLALAAASALPAAGTAQGVFVGPPETGISRDGLTGQRAHIARELPRFGFRQVDVRTLTNLQVARIDQVVHGNGSHGDIRARIDGIVRRGFLQRGLDSIRN